SAAAITDTSSWFAAPSTGGACRRTSSASPRVPATPDFAARGITRTLRMIPSVVGWIILWRLGRALRILPDRQAQHQHAKDRQDDQRTRDVGEARPLDQNSPGNRHEMTHRVGL